MRGAHLFHDSADGVDHNVRAVDLNVVPAVVAVVCVPLVERCANPSCTCSHASFVGLTSSSGRSGCGVLGSCDKTSSGRSPSDCVSPACAALSEKDFISATPSRVLLKVHSAARVTASLPQNPSTRGMPNEVMNSRNSAARSQLPCRSLTAGGRRLACSGCDESPSTIPATSLR